MSSIRIIKPFKLVGLPKDAVDRLIGLEVSLTSPPSITLVDKEPNDWLVMEYPENLHLISAGGLYQALATKTDLAKDLQYLARQRVKEFFEQFGFSEVIGVPETHAEYLA